MITICTWLWGNKYSIDYLKKLRAGVARHLKQPYRFICCSDLQCPLDGMETFGITRKDLLQVKGCFVRLQMFSRPWQQMHRIVPGDRLVSMDLDSIVTGGLDSLFDRKESFCILQGANAKNPCPYNGSLWMLRAGEHEEAWNKFSVAEASAVPFFEFPDDQGWMAHTIPNAAGWQAGRSGVYAFQKPGWPRGNGLPADARLVVFPGYRDPGFFTRLPWVREHWKV